MPVCKELHDAIDLLGQYDERYQREAIEAVMRIVNRAEQNIADSHMSPNDRQEVRLERVQRSRQRLREAHERVIGKARAEELRAHKIWMLRAQLADLEKIQQQDRKERGLD